MADRAALRLTLALPGLPALSIGLSRLRTDIADWTDFWKQRFAPFFYTMVRQDFVLEGGASGPSWAPLSPAYAAWKASRFPGAGILVRSGALKASLSGPDAPLAIFRAGATNLEIGTSVPYAHYHQYGAQWSVGNRRARAREIGRPIASIVTLPQRPPMRVSAAFMTVVGKELQAYVQDAWKVRRAAFIADVKAGLQEGLA